MHNTIGDVAPTKISPRYVLSMFLKLGNLSASYSYRKGFYKETRVC